MNPLDHGGIVLLLYAFVALSALALAAVWLTDRRGARNAGFATRRQLRRHLSAKAALSAEDVRPELADDRASSRRLPGRRTRRG